MSRRRILVIEDNPDNMVLIADVLSSLNYDVLQATDGQRGVEMVDEERPDLVLMDLSLPKMDGWTATRKLKSETDLKTIPIIALTAHAMVGDRERAMEAGCDGYVSKPINIQELAAKLKKFLG